MMGGLICRLKGHIVADSIEEEVFSRSYTALDTRCIRCRKHVTVMVTSYNREEYIVAEI